MEDSQEETQEQAFIRAFIEPRAQERFLGFVANPKRRVKFLSMLYNPHSLSGLSRVSNTEDFPEPVERLLRQKGAGGTCYVFSPDPALDRREMPLGEALAVLMTRGGAGVVSCIPGRLAYLKAEHDGYILERKDLHRTRS